MPRCHGSLTVSRLASLFGAALILAAATVGCGSSGSSGGGTGGGAAGGGVSGSGGRATGSGGATIGSGGASVVDAGTTSGGRGSGGATGNGGAGPSDGGVAGANLGMACAADTECGTGLLCLKPTDSLIFGMGGPAHGLCTAACTNAVEQANCTTFGGTCLDLALNAGDPPQAFCLQNCTFGGDINTFVRESKCRGRADVACTSLVDNSGAAAGAACIPTCSQDIDCPTGRHCDPLSSVCVNTATSGDRLGAHCTQGDGGVSSCAGACIAIGSATATVASFCTQRCVFGELNACNAVQGTSAAGGMHGVCALTETGALPGDRGFCAVECATVADCPDRTDPMPICDQSQAANIGAGICSWGSAAPADAGTGG